jgi:PAS domain S-box-containing protein
MPHVPDDRAAPAREAEAEARDNPELVTALHAERDRAQRYLDVAGVMLVGLDPAGRVTLANRRACELLGYPVDEIVGQVWADRFVPEADAAYVERFLARLAEGEIEYSERRTGLIVTASGETRSITWQNARVGDANGRFVGSLSSGLDVTEQLSASAALRQSQDTMAAILTAMPDLVLHQDADGRYLNCFKAPDVDTLLPEREFLGKLMEDVLPDSLAEEGRKLITAVLATGAVASAAYDMDMPDGARSYDMRMAPVGADEVVSVIRDVTDSRVAASKLGESERRFRSLFDESPLGLMVADDRGVVLAANRAMASFLRTTPEEVQGRTLADITHPDDVEATQDLVGRLLSGPGASERVDTRYLRVDGVVVHARVQTVSHRDALAGDGDRNGDGDGRIFALVDDMTERRHTDGLLATRTRQQSALAQFSQEALAGRDVPSLMQRACELVANALDVEYAKVLQLLPGGDDLLLKAGVGWEAGVVGHAILGADADTQAGHTLTSGELVVVTDLAKETRFRSPQLLLDHNIVGGMSVAIAGADRGDVPYGVLGIHTTTPRSFSSDDAGFLRTFAIYVTTAIIRARREAEIEELNARLEARVGERTRELHDANELLQSELRLREQTSETLRRSEWERSQLTQRILTVQEDEQAHIARELHDRAGQGLSSLLVGLRLLSRQAGSVELRDALEELRNQTSDTLDSIRNLAFEMRPTSLDHLGLAPTLEQDVRRLGTQMQISVDFLAGPTEREPLPKNVEIAIYRAVHAALTNAARHSEASNVSVTMQRRDGRLSIVVEDDGVGFDVDAVSDGPVDERFGLLGMEERMRPFGGRVHFESSPGAGTSVFIELPVGVGVDAQTP